MRDAKQQPATRLYVHLLSHIWNRPWTSPPGQFHVCQAARMIVFRTFILLLLFASGTSGTESVELPRHDALSLRSQATHAMASPEPTEFQAALAQVHDVNDERKSRQYDYHVVSTITFINLIYSFFRPSLFGWATRIPRILWEVSIILVSMGAALSPTLSILLSIMTGSTALVDVFLWAPIFSAFVSFERCSGGWFTGRSRTCVSDYQTGLLRLCASTQYLAGGIFYLWASIMAWKNASLIQQDIERHRYQAFLGQQQRQYVTVDQEHHNATSR